MLSASVQKISLSEALTGFTKTITTLDDRRLLIQSDPGEVIKHGESGGVVSAVCISAALGNCLFNFTDWHNFEHSVHFLSLSAYFLCSGDLKVVLNEGMPQYRNPYDKGRLVIKFDVRRKKE